MGMMLVGVPLFAGAQDPGDVNIRTEEGVIGLLLNLLALARTIFWIIAVAVILWAAFLYLTAAGDAAKIGKANSMLMYAVIAIVVALIATSLPFLIRSLLT